MTPEWYVRRLAAMPADEVAFRIGFTFTKKRWRRHSKAGRLFRASSVPCSGFPAPLPALSTIRVAPDGAEAAALIDEANAARRQEWRFFGLSGVVEPTIDWHLDPLSGRRAPRIFSYDIDHRDERHGDPKIIWEKSRHQHLTVLAAAYAITGNEAYAREAETQLLTWIADNPCLIGINWGHPLELGIRLISWVWVERLLRGSPHHDTLFGSRSPVWQSIGLHQEVISRAYSRGSSANNHLIGEMAGLFIASVAFPYFRSSHRWTKISMKILEREVVRQTFPSGINRELAFGYQLFVAEFLLLSLFEGERAGLSFSAEFRSLLAKTVEAIPDLTDVGGNLPRYGDGDDGMALQLQSHEASRTAWLFQLAGTLLGIGNAAGSGPSLPIVLMGAAASLPLHTDRPLQRCTAFQDAGLYVMSVDRGTPSEIFLLADAGPLGFGSMAAHGHADALSFTLSVGGKPIFIDPGTYSYYTDRTTRDYFRGSRGHNTLTVDDKDQSKPAGMFLWSAQAKTTVSRWHESSGDGLELTGRHNGFAASLGIIHCRTFSLEKSTVGIRDMLSGSGDHLVTLGFHFAPECGIENEMNRRILIHREEKTVVLGIDDRLAISLHRGDRAGGWYSPRFGMKIASNTLFASARFTLPVTLTTTIEVLDER
jgi:hypothetical protein